MKTLTTVSGTVPDLMGDRLFLPRNQGRSVGQLMHQQNAEPGFLQIPNEVLKRLFKAGLSGRELALVLAVIQKTSSRNKNVV
jgi:hypothetical protein